MEQKIMFEVFQAEDLMDSISFLVEQANEKKYCFEQLVNDEIEESGGTVIAYSLHPFLKSDALREWKKSQE